MNSWRVWRAPCWGTILVWYVGFLLGATAACSEDIKPQDLLFRRQATQRMVFDRSQNIPLAKFIPATVHGLDVMHPELGPNGSKIEPRQEAGKLLLETNEAAETTRWVGGFNPFATYEVDVHEMNSYGDVGVRFQHREKDTCITACLSKEAARSVFAWTVVIDGRQSDRQEFPVRNEILDEGPFTIRVQMQAVGANLFIEQHGRTELIGAVDFSQHFDLRKVSEMQLFDFGFHCKFPGNEKASVVIDGAQAVLTPGCGQADIRAITNRDGSPLIENGRIWLTMTVRGRALPHPLQGVFSLNPTVFDIKFEGIIVFDMGDGLWRNDVASHLFYDEVAKQWRGWTTGFSALANSGDNGNNSGTSKKNEKEILAIWSDLDPRKGFSVMKARPIGMRGEHEDPHGVYDETAKKWRLLISERAEKYRAGMWESDNWDKGFVRVAGPVEMDSTGTLIQKVGDKRYAFFGSADRKVYIRSYPTLEQVGELKMHLPPWTDKTGTRIWPNIIPLPDGYPSPYIALMMDRINFPNMPKSNWTYGAMYLYHANP